MACYVTKKFVAISCISAGWISSAANDTIFDAEVVANIANTNDNLSAKNVTPDTSSGDELMRKVLKTVINEYLVQPQSRAAGCIWLLSLVKNASKHGVMHSQLPVAQMAFSQILSDPNEVVQEGQKISEHFDCFDTFCFWGLFSCGQGPSFSLRIWRRKYEG